MSESSRKGPHLLADPTADWLSRAKQLTQEKKYIESFELGKAQYFQDPTPDAFFTMVANTECLLQNENVDADMAESQQAFIIVAYAAYLAFHKNEYGVPDLDIERYLNDVYGISIELDEDMDVEELERMIGRTVHNMEKEVLKVKTIKSFVADAVKKAALS